MNSVTPLILDEPALVRCQGGFLPLPPSFPPLLPFGLDDVPGLRDTLQQLMRPQTLSEVLRQLGLSVEL